MRPKARRQRVLLSLPVKVVIPDVLLAALVVPEGEMQPGVPQNSSNAWTRMAMAKSTRKSLPS